MHLSSLIRYTTTWLFTSKPVCQLRNYRRPASTMPKVLCVAEKPSIARAIANIFGGGSFTTRESRDKYVKNFDTTFDFGGNWGNCQVTITSVLGHTLSTDFPPEYGSWSKYPVGIPFDIRPVTQVDKTKLNVAENIRNNARNSQYLYIWTDCDREGEYIGTEIRDIALQGNPWLQVKRARFSNIERAHILRAARNPVDIDERQAQAVQARIELDLRIGAAFTRFQTLRIAKSFAPLENMILSYGSCQFPTLGFVVDRWRRIHDFTPEPFWSIKVMHSRDQKQVTFTWKRNRLFDRMAVTILFEQCLQAKLAKIKSEIEKPSRKWKPLPLTTVELQKQGSRFLGIDSQTIMQIAEKLYQKGFVSYPRTETDQFDKDMDLKALCEKQTRHPIWGEYARGLVEDDRFRQPRNGKNNDKAHPPIHPITMVAPDSLQDNNDRRVYEFITRRFLACCSEDALGKATTVTLGFGPEEFTAHGLVVLARNYLDVYPYDRWSTNEIPNFVKGEEFAPDRAEMTEGKTTAPGFLTEPELIALMDANGIGTDATMAEHIKTIIERGYVFATAKGRRGGGGNGDEDEEDDEGGGGGAARGRGRGRGRGGRGGRGGGRGGGNAGDNGGGGGGVREFVPSNVGIALIEGYDNMNFEVNLSKPFLRKEMEENMKAVCEGRKTKEQFLQESLEMYRDVFEAATRQVAVLKTAMTKHLNG